MQKLSRLLLCISLLHSVYASDEGPNPFAEGHRSVPIKSINYEPLEIEFDEVGTVDVIKEKKSSKPWYKSRRLWMGAAIGATVVAGLVSLVYSLTAGDEETGSNPIVASPSLSPLPSMLASITSTALASVTATASAVYASMSGSRTGTITPSWTSTETDSPWSYSRTPQYSTTPTRTATESFPYPVEDLCRNFFEEMNTQQQVYGFDSIIESVKASYIFQTQNSRISMSSKNITTAMCGWGSWDYFNVDKIYSAKDPKYLIFNLIWSCKSLTGGSIRSASVIGCNSTVYLH